MRNNVKGSRDLILITLIFMGGGFALGKSGVGWDSFLMLNIVYLTALIFIILMYAQLNNTGG